MASKSHCLVIMVWPMLWHDYRLPIVISYCCAIIMDTLYENIIYAAYKKDTAQKQLWRAKAALQKHLKGDA